MIIINVENSCAADYLLAIKFNKELTSLINLKS